MGHSRGGQAAFQVVQRFEEFDSDLGISPVKLSAAVALAPLSAEPNGEQGSSPIPAERAVPYFVLIGGNDEDVGAGNGARAYDIMASDEAAGVSAVDKVLLWAHDVAHVAWGGVDPTDLLSDPNSGITLTEFNKAHAISSNYIRSFLRWQVLDTNSSVERQWFADLARPSIDLMDGIPDYPANSILTQSLWDTILPPWTDLMRPLIFVDLSFGADSGEFAPLRVDTMVRENPVPCGPVSPASGDGMVTVLGLDPEQQVCVDDAISLSFSTNAHETRAMRVIWGGAFPDGSIEWSISEDLTAFSYLSVRAGNSYASSVVAAFDVTLSLHGLDLQGEPLVASVNMDPLVSQDDSPPVIFVADLMHTIRIPLQAFCAQGLDLTTVNAVSITLPPSMDEQRVLIDSLEFTRASDDGLPGCI